MKLTTVLSIVGATSLSLLTATVLPARAQPAPPPACTASDGVTPICTVHAPEDLELLPGGKQIVVSQLPDPFNPAATSGLAVLDLANDHVAPLPLTSKFRTGWGDSSCTQPLPHLWSHGIHLSHRRDGVLQLFVVNHNARESIESIELKPASGGYVGIWHGCVTHPTGLFNDVSATGDGGFIATISSEKSAMVGKANMGHLLSGADTGYLVEWRPGIALHKLPNSEAPFNNGVQVSPDGKLVYFNAWTGKQVRVYDRAAQRVTRHVDVPFYPDNLSWRADGKLLAAGILDLGIWKQCFAPHVAFCSSPFTVAVLDPQTLAQSTLYQGRAGLISGASVGVQTGDELYVGTFMGDRMLKIDLGHH